MGKEYYQRFGINISLEEAKTKFVNRVYMLVFRNLREGVSSNPQKDIELKVAAVKIGIDNYRMSGIEKIVDRDYYRTLDAVAAIYHESGASSGRQIEIDRGVIKALEESEVDLGIYWDKGHFYLSGAKLLDDELVNTNLNWLLEKGYDNVYIPFEGALQHYSESIKYPDKLNDVVTNMHKALEATAKIVGNNDHKLSKNAEKFISNLGLTEQHKEMLKQYIDYANEMARHAQSPSKKRKVVSRAEAENFIYLTGLFIRFAIQKLDE
ncbi:MAG: hypothetical protein IIA59_13555 [Candidatus Marinimicrobia bacterium]|nr:hypothetical protein [Candidatus Neomarinimicrobiota bacterium]